MAQFVQTADEKGVHREKSREFRFFREHYRLNSSPCISSFYSDLWPESQSIRFEYQPNFEEQQREIYLGVSVRLSLRGAVFDGTACAD